MSRTDPDVSNLVVSLAARGLGHRRIARDLGLSRNTVRGILERQRAQRDEGHSALPARQRRASILDGWQDAVAELVDRYPEITAVRLQEELAERGFSGGYTVVKQRRRELRRRPKAKPVERFETEPGEQGQQDWSPYTLDFSEAGRQTVHAFGLLLGFSRRFFLSFGEREDFYTLIRQHKAAFEYFGGVPFEMLYDNQKAIVVRREGGQPIYNPRFLAFATHYGFRPVALPPGRPDLKGKEERSFSYVEGNLLCGRSFRDLAHLNEVALWWLAERADTRVHRTTGERPIDRFVREAPHLLPLPARPYDDAEVGYRVVSVEGTILWDSTPYSVPDAYLLDIVAVRATADEVVVYGPDLREIARHHKAPRGWTDVVRDPAHRSEARRARNDLDALSARLAELDESGAVFAKGVLDKQRYRGAHLARVLALRERYATDDLLAALRRAVAYRAFDARIVERILETTATPRVLPDTATDTLRERLRDIVPPSEPRAMSHYAAALRDDTPEDTWWPTTSRTASARCSTRSACATGSPLSKPPSARSRPSVSPRSPRWSACFRPRRTLATSDGSSAGSTTVTCRTARPSRPSTSTSSPASTAISSWNSPRSPGSTAGRTSSWSARAAPARATSPRPYA